MLRKSVIIAIALSTITLLTGQLAFAESGKPDLSRLQNILAGATPSSVTPSPIPGLYEVILGSQILYISEDGQFAVSGDVINLATRSNMTEARRSDIRSAAIADVGEDNMIIFAPEEPAKHTVTVFTDIDCGYCRKLHQEIASYNQAGIAVRYLLFPRAGIGSPSYDKAVTAWCSADRQDAITRSKLGEVLPQLTCDNPVKHHYELGQMVGVQGTPSIILENGQMVPGYVPADRLAQILNNGGS